MSLTAEMIPNKMDKTNFHSNNLVDISPVEKQTLTSNDQIKVKGKPKFAVGSCNLFCFCMLEKK